MDSSGLVKESLYLSKDAEELAFHLVELDKTADVSIEKTIVAKAAAVETMILKKDELIARCLQRYQDSTDITGVSIEKAITELVDTETRNIKTDQHKYCQNFETAVKKVRTAQTDDDEMDMDVVESSLEKKFICPITKERFVHPMKNYDGIMSILKDKSSANCPVAGCNMKVTMISLKVDEDMEWKMVIDYPRFNK